MIDITKFNKLSKNFGYDHNYLSDLLFNTNSFISGSFALSVFLNEKFESQDLDIYVPLYIPKDEHKNSDFVKYLMIHNKDTTLNNYEKYLNYMYDESLINDIGYTYLENESKITKNDLSNNINFKYTGSLIKYVKTYGKVDPDTNIQTKVQVIFLNECKIEELLKSFDLNIVRLAIVSTSINEMQFYHKINNYITNHNLQTILDKNMYFPDLILEDSRLATERLFKYTNRGFKYDYSYHSHCKKYIEDQYINKYIDQKYGNKRAVILNTQTDNDDDLFIKNYVANKNNLLKTNIYELLKKYEFNENDLKYNTIYDLNSFNLYPSEQYEDAKTMSKLLENNNYECSLIHTNMSFKIDLYKYLCNTYTIPTIPIDDSSKYLYKYLCSASTISIANASKKLYEIINKIKLDK